MECNHNVPVFPERDGLCTVHKVRLHTAKLLAYSGCCCTTLASSSETPCVVKYDMLTVLNQQVSSAQAVLAKL